MTVKRITALKAQKRNQNRVSVYLDGEYALGLSRIVAAWLSVGQEISEEKIAELQEQDAHEMAYQGAIKLIDYRMRSAKEIEGHLKRKGIQEETIAGVMERLNRSGLVDDGAFSRTWVENRVDFRPRSRRVLKMELHQKGIPDEEIQAALEGIESEEELAYRAAERYARKGNYPDRETFRKKLGGYLARKGFSYSTASQVIERVWTERGSNGNTEG
jgi:regulatory protein